MPPHDKYSHCEQQLIITGHAIGVHTISLQGQEFEIRLFPSPNADTTGSSSTAQNHGEWSSKNKKQKKNKNKQSRGVRFNRLEYIRSVPHKSEITPEDKAILWTNYHDWQSTQKERQRVSQAIALGHLTAENQTDTLVLRGLEAQIPHVGRQRRESVHFARTLVFREQYRARLEVRPIDPDHLAWCYGSAAEESRVQAFVRGLQDYHQVLQQDDGNVVALFSAIV